MLENPKEGIDYDDDENDDDDPPTRNATARQATSKTSEDVPPHKRLQPSACFYSFFMRTGRRSAASNPAES